MKKLPAYTLLEITVAMLLSAICIAICYSAFSLAGWYYSELGKKREIIANLQQLDELLGRDFKNASEIHSNKTSLQLHTDSGIVSYNFADKAIIRDHFGIRKDSLTIALDSVTFFFEGKRLDNEDLKLTDEIHIAGKTGGKAFEITRQKHYSATNLFTHATD